MPQALPTALQRFLTSEARGGLLLIGSACLALIVANSGWVGLYHDALGTRIGSMSVELWVNDGLMSVFFLLVGLEIKREFVAGDLARPQTRRLPLIAAAAGMALPALVFLVVSGGDASLVHGWAIPAATDIAFALGILALAGSRVPSSLKLLLTTIAIADDLGAVAIIAFAYTDGLNPAALAAAGLLFGTLWLAGRRRQFSFALFAPAAGLLWYLTLLSGVHATIAGVLAALVVPVRTGEDSPLHRLEHALSPWVAYLILPLFGFANAGVSLRLAAIDPTLPLAIGLGLFLGKQAGIFAAIRLCVRLKIAEQPAGSGWLQIYGMSLLCGIGFTMSLFIGALAFPGRPELVEDAKIGILIGSLASALAGYFVLRLARPGDLTVPKRDESARFTASD